ncbi:Dolichyl-Diphosphooligosaccharide--Protein Glycosyltransferase 48 Kda Subunit [Manis pentadactyla]|nr:Dolichyl-Diphosphooligosaccharide--Protein Glycosyltransferase 48 Kda Subunit [Manis pentadactyla]
MTDIEADGVGSDTLALWKDLGSGSDMTGSARWWIRVMLKCRILTPGLGLELVTLALRKELGSGSYVTGVQDVGTGLWVRVSSKGMSIHMIRLWREFLFNSDGEYAIQFQDYSEAIVVSMVILEFQATGPR